MGRKRRILQINKLYYPFTGGIESVVQQIAERLQSVSTMQVLVCNTERQTVHEAVNGVKVTRTGCIKMIGNLPLSVQFFIEFRKQAKRNDILLFHMPFPIGDLAYFLSGIRKKKVIVWWHSDIVRQKKLLIFYKPLMKWFLNHADRIIVATKGHIEGSDYLKPYREKCVIIPFGVRKEILTDSTKYLMRKKMQHRNQKIVGADREKEVRFLFVGRLTYYKGCQILLRAFQNVKGAKLAVVGDGPLREEMEQDIVKHHMQKRVELKGWLTDSKLFQEYRACDVLVLPSVARSEAFGLVQIEAMAYGKPVINTNLLSGVPYVSLNQVTGLTVEPNNSKALYQAFVWMIEHPKERIRMGECARKRVEDCFTEQEMIHKLWRLWKEI